MRPFISSLLIPAAAVLVCAQPAVAQWREATRTELSSLIPARAPVGEERIETEARTASGITDGHGHFVAGVLLITAGYSAEGKYSHYLIVQAPMRIEDMSLEPGNYVFGYRREGDALTVSFYQAADGKPRGTLTAPRTETNGPIRSFAIKPTGSKGVIQIGRFGLHYELTR
jgi:hypothetical protein